MNREAGNKLAVGDHILVPQAHLFGVVIAFEERRGISLREGPYIKTLWLVQVKENLYYELSSHDDNDNLIYYWRMTEAPT